MAPTPKPPEQRVRRNKDQPRWVQLPPAGDFKRPPTCPPKWSATTKKWWKLIWNSPMAAMWVESDIPALTRLGDMLEMKPSSATAAANVTAEIRQIEDRFGLSPKSRRALQWEITRAADEETEAPRQGTRKRHLRAVG